MYTSAQTQMETAPPRRHVQRHLEDMHAHVLTLLCTDKIAQKVTFNHNEISAIAATTCSRLMYKFAGKLGGHIMPDTGMGTPCH